MPVLAIDTSLEDCAVALSVDGGPPSIVREAVGRGHGERLTGLVAEILDAAGLAIADLERIGVALGPGSFTGIRIGVAAVRGLALVAGTPSVGISNLAVHAAKARGGAGGRRIVVATRAARGDAYTQAYGPGGEALEAPTVAAVDQIAATLADDVCLAGSAAPAVAAIAGLGAERIVNADASPDAAVLLRLVSQADATGDRPKPLYVRPPDAKPQTGASVARR